MNISIIIPNYNGEKILQKNLPKVLDAVKDYQNGNVEIIIPDDPSTDNSKDVIEAFIKSINQKNIVGKTIENKNKREAGFSKNVNRGVSVASGDILILLNSDVAPHQNFLSPLLKHFRDDQVFAVACMDESIEENGIVNRGRGIGKWERGFLNHKAGELHGTETLWASGGSSAFSRKIWDKLRGLDVLFNPFYWEDIDLSYRAHKSGYKVLFEKQSIVIHEHDKGAIKTKFKPAHIRKIAYRNQFIFIWKNITQRKLLLSHAAWLPYHFLNALRNRDWVFFTGFGAALVQLTQIRQSRIKARKLYVKTDTEVLNMFKQ